MKPLYTRFFRVTPLFFLLLFFISNVYAQCPDPGTTAFDTTISFPSGVLNRQVKFAQFDPQNGMVTCVNFCVTIKGVIDSVAIENYTSSPQDANYTYNRKDTIRGPGIPTFLTSAPTNLSFGPYPLDPFDGVYDSGLDLYTRGPDTVLTKQLCANISDSTTIAQFYGTDSVTYNYSIDASATGDIPGGSGSALVRSSALVNFHFEYCTCPPIVLPSNIHQFSVTKLTPDKAELKWTGFDNPYADYSYEAEMSRDGHNFSSIGSFPKNTDNTDAYRLVYRAVTGEKGIYFFRIRQVYSTGHSKYSNIKQVNLENSDFPTFTLYPNPSNGIVGIKFDNILNGHFKIYIYNTQGQVMVKKDIAAAESSYIEVATLQRGVYWVRLTDVKSQLSGVNQLLIK